MPSLSVRKADEEIVNLLRAQAEKHGVSMEEEVCQIIKWSVTTPERLGDGYAEGEGLEIASRQTY